MSCPVCNGTARVLGTLGARTHLRCESCGMEFSTEEDYDEEHIEAQAQHDMYMRQFDGDL